MPSQFVAGAKQAAQAIARFDNTLIAAHVGLDGDAFGSIVAMGYMLRSLGRNFALYSETGVPRHLSFIKQPGPVYTSLSELPFAPESAIYLDCSEPSRLGSELARLHVSWPSVNIDHHIVDHGMGSVANYIEPAAAATAQLVAYTGLALQVPLQGELACALALGIVTDTGGFCHGNTTAAVLELSAQLILGGCDLAALREKLDAHWSLARLRLWGQLLHGVQLEHDHQVAMSRISLEDLRRHDCTAEDVEGLVEWLRKIRDIKVAVVLREIAAGQWKFSLRSFGDVDVRTMAAQLGGGGHKNAAGGTIDLPAEDAEKLLLKTIGSCLDA